MSKVKEFELTADVYGWKVLVVSGPKKKCVRRINRFFKRGGSSYRLKKRDLDGCDGMHSYHGRRSSLYTHDLLDLEVAGHELFHVTVRIVSLMEVGTKPSEAGAILFGHLLSQYLDKSGVKVSL